MAVALAITMAVTGLRLYLRCFRRDLRLGLDDAFILLAALGVCSWVAMVIAMAVIGGAGRHLYALTYRKIYWFFRLSSIMLRSTPRC